MFKNIVIMLVCLASSYSVLASSDWACDSQCNTVLEIMREYSPRYITLFNFGQNADSWAYVDLPKSGKYITQSIPCYSYGKYSFLIKKRNYNEFYEGDSNPNPDLNDPGSSLWKINIKPNTMNFIKLDADRRVELQKPVASIGKSGNGLVTTVTCSFPVDCDHDGLDDDDEEELYHCSPSRYDSDFDGLSDGEEVRLGTHPYLWDTDGDGIGDKEDDDKLMPYMRKNYDEWVRHWSNVLVRLGEKKARFDRLIKSGADYDGDGIDNYAEFKNGTSPIWKPGEFRAVFTPDEMVCRDDSCGTNYFSVTVCSHNAVTGLVCIANLNLGAGLRMVNIQEGIRPPGVDKGPADCDYFLFIARYGVPLQYYILLPYEEPSKNSSAEVFLLSGKGQTGERLRIYSSGEAAAELSKYPMPVLVSPMEGEIVHGGKISFSWKGDYNETVKYKLALVKDTDGVMKEIDRGGNFDYSDWPETSAHYSWQVSVYDSKGRKELARSVTSSFTYLHKSMDKDSDGDGYSDNEEFLAGTDFADGNDMPLSAGMAAKSLEGMVNRHFFQTLSPKGGRPPFCWYSLTAMPDGLNVGINGSISGTPTKAGNYELKLLVCDSSGQEARCLMPLTIQESKPSEVRLGSGEIGEVIK